MASIIDLEQLPAQFPTHRHDPAFWEMRGRAVATCGFLEEVPGKAIFSFTAHQSPVLGILSFARRRRRLCAIKQALDPAGIMNPGKVLP